MDIIASHRSGLIEQFEVEAVALAGGPADSGQRAIVYHHVADMLGLSHGFALLCANTSLGMDAVVARIAARAGRWSLRSSRAGRTALVERVGKFGATLRALDAERCAAMLTAYRLVATPGLGGEAAARLAPDLLAALQAAHGARGEAERAVRRALFQAHQAWVADAFGGRVDEAIAALGWPHSPRLAARARDLLLVAAPFERVERRGVAAIERRLRASKQLPAHFAANPAQAFFKLQQRIIERGRRGADLDYLSPDEAVRLAA